jgi:C-8 sterol isomerase
MAYLFHPDRLHEIARKYVNVPPEQLVQGVTDDLARAYPGHIETRRRWLFNLAGGCVGVMSVLHASLSEYVLLFGTPIGAGGFSGRYWMDVYDFLLAGEIAAYTEECCLQPIVTRPGELALLRQGQAKGFKVSEGSWMLEYGRGFVPASLPFALGDALFSCFEPVTIVKTLWVYGGLVVKELFKGKI